MGKWDKNWRLASDEADSRAGTYGESEWDDFQVGSEATNYQLGFGKQRRKVNWIGDPFSDSQWDLNGMAFSTKDRDNDRASWGNCASGRGGWWFRNCNHICLTCNGKEIIYDGIKWRRP